MNLLSELENKTPSGKLKAFSKSTIVVLSVIIIVLGAGYGGTFVWAKTYDNRIAPNVFIGTLEIGGMNFDAAKKTINAAADEFLLNGVQLFIDGKAETVPLVPVSADAREYVVLKTNEVLSQAQTAHKSTNKFLRPFELLWSKTHDSIIPLQVELNREQLTGAVLNAFPQSIQSPVDSGFKFEKTEESWLGEATPSADGLTISTDEFFAQLENHLSSLDFLPIVLTKTVVQPTILEKHVEQLLPAAIEILNNAPFSLVYDDSVWEITDENLSVSLKIELDEDKKASIVVDDSSLQILLDNIAAEIEKPAVDARLNIEDGRVLDFQASSNGLSIDREAAISKLSEVFSHPSNEKTVELVTIIVEPQVKMSSVNDLGINEVLGVGTSSYKGSPSNRVKNIRNGVKLLNGVLIAPDQEFSLLNALKPFTADNGYYPELVIKGDKIEPEVGGGLCQIGTTTFRAAMNSGLPITNRNNHSLVVSYYNDPSNGNPGTDATIYDPAPDFKFINNTGHYILFQAEMDEINYQLNFSFWGTSDGRKGSYTPPVVARWIPVGETQMIETTDLEPGVENCQSAHVGADASFTYTITNPDGTFTDELYESHYRPLPKICLVGVEPSPPTPLPEGEGEIIEPETATE